jgi:hypothetical protein
LISIPEHTPSIVPLCRLINVRDREEEWVVPEKGPSINGCSYAIIISSRTRLLQASLPRLLAAILCAAKREGALSVGRRRIAAEDVQPSTLLPNHHVSTPTFSNELKETKRQQRNRSTPLPDAKKGPFQRATNSSIHEDSRYRMSLVTVDLDE